MDKASAQRKIEAYMTAFNARDMEALGAVLAEDASLTDWEVNAAGKEALVAATNRIVSGARVQITVRRLILDLPIAAADLIVRVNDELQFEVIDLFEFNNEGLIKSVRAFKGPERGI